MKYTTIIFPVLLTAVAAGQGKAAKGRGGKAAGGASAGGAGAGGAGAGAGDSTFAGGANNAGASGAAAANGLPQLPNPGPNIPVPTSFTPVSSALAGSTPAARVNNAQAKAALQAAADNWSFDTGMVSNFQNTGKSLANDAAGFQNAANVAYNAEVDELAHKAILDQIIGNDPDVSIANQTLTNGVFQSVVDNLQIMSLQGPDQQGLIDNINNVRCAQILPSIDTYLAVAARVIGQDATLRTAIRPDACAAIVQASDDSAFPGNLNAVDIRGNTDKTTNGNDFVGTGSPTVQAPAAGGAGEAAGGNNGNTGAANNGGAAGNSGATGANGGVTGANGGVTGANGGKKAKKAKAKGGKKAKKAKKAKKTAAAQGDDQNARRSIQFVA
ncbi:hypothetical protein EJ08DRAFT_666628 [Tothia fuscella]|uniref:Uncharacterized protein n=1 Tax=Tothia fuscella TaxID=1048955 RepID=A0A9P4NE36_9PEZI|nr:hypothetical protein EJ08DRAFT_666628 [Tothia fuscella]